MANSPYHSENLQRFFNIRPCGVDFINRNGILVEFKETFSEKTDLRDIIFKVEHFVFDESDFIVFCIGTSKYYVHKTRILKQLVSRKAKCGLTSIRAERITKGYIYKTTDINKLRAFIRTLKRGI